MSNFLQDNLVGLLLTLLAINTATSSVISSKLEEVSSRTGANFIDVVKEIKFSLIEQIILITVSIVSLICYESEILINKVENLQLFLNVILTTVLIYSIEILRDTGVTIFNIIIELNKDSKGP